MKRYKVLLAYDVPFYAEVIVEAKDEEEANRKALREASCTADFDPSYDAASDTRIADDAIEIDEDGTPVEDTGG